ncbi:hypothetical protein FHG87_001877 [Trinorchestia longiramus]|nr:hypothetical protein FHG87_001877 [Trinorchestia longiramus]
MLDRSPLKVDLPLHPQARRRAYSDSGKPMLRPLFRRLASPPPMLCPLSTLPSVPLTTIEAKVPLETPRPTPSIPIPTRNDAYETFEVGSPPAKGASPVSLASNLAAPDSPSLSRYAGMVVGSPLGLGPLNGQHLTALDHSPACSTDNISATGSPTLMSDLLPMVRPRLPSVSETPSVAPIPENLPLPDTPRRPPLLGSYSLEATWKPGSPSMSSNHVLTSSSDTSPSPALLRISGGRPSYPISGLPRSVLSRVDCTFL